MTLLQFLATLKADPREDPGVELIFAENKLTAAQREQVAGSTYSRRPYAVIINESVGAPIRLHNGRGLFNAAVDIHLFHPSTMGVEPDGEAISTLQAELLKAQDEVDEVRVGYPLASRFQMISEIPSQLINNENFDGLQAITRFVYRLWR